MKKVPIVDSKVSNTGRLRRLALLVMAAAAVLVAPAHAVFAQSSGATLEGVWVVEVTLRNCDTGAPLGPSFNSLVTFTRGGTVIEASGALGFAPGQRPGAHGTWAHDGGRRYAQRMISLILFTTPPGPGPGFEAGWQTIDQVVELLDADHMESEGGNWFYRSNGELYRTGCSTATGQRFK